MSGRNHMLGRSTRRALVVAVNELRLLAVDPFPIILLIAIPSLIAAFISKGLVGGAAIAVPGLAALFGFFGLSTIGFTFYRDHGWSTWSRLRTTPASVPEVVLGKLIPLTGLFLAQQAVLLIFGVLVLDMPWRGSVGAGIVAIVCIVAVEVAIGLLFAAICRTINQLNAVCNLGGLLLAGIGGALAPVSTFPAWVRHLAPASPVYWGLRMLRGVIADGNGLSQLAEPAAILLAIAAVAGGLAILRLRAGDVKEFYASR